MFCRSNHVLIPDNVKHFDSDYCISGITLLIIITSLFQVNISLFYSTLFLLPFKAMVFHSKQPTGLPKETQGIVSCVSSWT